MLFRRTVIAELTATGSVVFCILMGILLTQRIGYLVQIAANGKLPNDAIMIVLGFSMVRFLPIVLSLTIFLAIIITLSRAYRDSEMIIWQNAGISIKQFLSPILYFTVPIVGIIFLLSVFFMPWAFDKSATYADQVKGRDELATIVPGVFKESAHADRVFFIEKFDSLGHVFNNIFMQSIKDKKLEIVVAKKAERIKDDDGNTFLSMYEGSRYQGIPNSAEFSSTHFQRYHIHIQRSVAKKTLPLIQSSSSYSLLRSHDAAYQAELQWRLSFPILAFILALLAIPLSKLEPRSSRITHFALAIIIYLIYNNLLSISQAWLIQGKIPITIGLWPVHAIFLAIALHLLGWGKFGQYMTPIKHLLRTIKR